MSLLDTIRASAVYLCGHGAIGSAEPDELHPSFAGWMAAGCPVPMDEEDFDDFDD